ncbi:high frequency lysogenization protein HflD [Hankyongella ginsenosidimutans]|uniref:High frequency lysogenization protein HflD n=1 Tax=Hankyongella ginsenosidimutans TaxID=1763828 RepID=A0A4D7C9V9_9SPHN|nr:high frequency lysogenization protein HflD [Hankyongella ginsenosidimutans]QCI79843.1 high frequency lysogenization protein HflD [Hankyongella ginsenosidimutans]
MGHALEPDHLAAVGSMATGKSSRGALVLRGAAWGMGHTITLFVICTAVILFGMMLTQRMAATMESAVGVMLVLLGGEVLWRMRRARVHFHVHQHADGERHFHAHSHLGEQTPHDARRHKHTHRRRALPMKALLVGLVHGAAGSSALVVLAVATVPNPWLASFYVLLFGLGSMAGMASLSLVASWPLGAAERFATRLHQGLSAAVALLRSH